MPALLLRLRSPTLHLPRTIRTPVHTPRLQTQTWTSMIQQTHARCYAQQPQNPSLGTTTPVPENAQPPPAKTPFYFEAGYALYAKRPSRPFPPPFLSLPSTSFSEPLSTHNKSRDRRPKVNGEMIRGVTNGDDAVLVSDYFVGANDGVGAWATRERGHAAYVSRQQFHAPRTNSTTQTLVQTNPPLLVARSRIRGLLAHHSTHTHRIPADRLREDQDRDLGAQRMARHNNRVRRAPERHQRRPAAPLRHTSRRRPDPRHPPEHKGSAVPHRRAMALVRLSAAAGDELARHAREECCA